MPSAHPSKKSTKKHATPTEAGAPTTTAPPVKTETTATPPAAVVQAPPTVTFPAIPESFVPIEIKNYLGVLPKAAQLAVMPGAVQELKNFADFAAVFGKTAPPQASVAQAFDIATLWSSLRSRTTVFEVFVACQEAMSWKEVHDYIARLQPAFELAVKSDATVGTEHPSLTRLFGAMKEIAAKGVATRKANKQLEAEGKPPIKGKVGKRRKTAAANALFEAATNGQAQSTAPATAAPATNGVTAGTGAATSTGNGTGH